MVACFVTPAIALKSLPYRIPEGREGTPATIVSRGYGSREDGKWTNVVRVVLSRRKQWTEEEDDDDEEDTVGVVGRLIGHEGSSSEQGIK